MSHPLELYILIVSFFLIALVYSSVGFGGGSSYLALLAVMAVSFEVLRPAALLCNIVVVTGGSIVFFREGHLDLKKYWPLLAVSVPMAFVGGYIPIKQNAFFLLLSFTLIVAALLLWFQDSFQKEQGPRQGANSVLLKIGLGGFLGLLSGMVSIGGGIFLSPILHLLRLDNAKKISALASVFILVNSVGGLAGQLARNSSFDWKFVVPLLVAVLAGGQLGSRLGAKRFNALFIKRTTAVLILLAGLNILKDHW